MGTSYIPFPPWALFFCFVPLMTYWLKEPSLKKVFISGWICQFIFTLIGFNWVAFTIHEFGGLPWFFSIVGLLLFCSFANLHIPLAGVVWHWVFKRTPNAGVRVIGLVALLAISERIFPMIFDWHLGYTWLWARFPAFQLADWVGFFGLSTITWIFQGLFLFTWNFRTDIRRLSGFATSLCAFFLMNIVGWFHQPEPQETPSTRISVIQANIGNLEKQLAEIGIGFRQSIIDRYITLSRKESSNQPHFYMWPETAFPDFLTQQSFMSGIYGAQVRSFLSETNTPLLTGTYGILPNGKMTNSFATLSSSGFLNPLYNKTHLLAFGEFIPGAKYFPILKKWLPMVADFERGPGPSVVQVGGLRFGLQICYEGLFDEFSRALAQKGAWILLNVTNDSWYGTWQQPYQHMTMTLARSIETRLPLVRATNTGISTVQLPTGKTLEKSPLSEPWSHTYEIPYDPQPQLTFFSGFGYWVFPIFLVALLLWSIWNRRRN